MLGWGHGHCSPRSLIHEPVLEAVERVITSGPPQVRAQARATLVVINDPHASFDGAMAQAQRQP